MSTTDTYQQVIGTPVDPETTTNWDIITPEEVELLTNDAALDELLEQYGEPVAPEYLETEISYPSTVYGPDHTGVGIFHTSGTSGRQKNIPYTPQDRRRALNRSAKTYRIAGATAEDTLLDLGAPVESGHISGWLFGGGVSALGGTVANTSFLDYEAAVDAYADNVTVVSSIPLAAYKYGTEIKEQYGAQPKDIFENVRLGFMSGDLLTDTLRSDLKNQWGFKEIHDAYGSVELGGMAAAPDESPYMIPLVDEFVFEIVPETVQNQRYKQITGNPSESMPDTFLQDYHLAFEESDIINILDMDDPTTGAVLLSDPDKEGLPLHRYLIGDNIRVHPGEPPSIEFMGRKDNLINLAGANLFPRQIEGAMNDVYGETVQEWAAVASRPNKLFPAVDFYAVTEAPPQENRFLTCLFDRNASAETAYNADTVEYLQMHTVTAVPALEDKLAAFDLEQDVSINTGPKARRIGFDASYYA